MFFCEYGLCAFLMLGGVILGGWVVYFQTAGVYLVRVGGNFFTGV